MKDEVDSAAKVLWDYNKLNQKPQTADAILALGSMDLRVAEKAAQLWHQKFAPLVVVSGGFGRLTGKNWQESEASKFHKILIGANVPDSQIIIEDKSSNAAENFQFSMAALDANKISTKKLIAVTKPYMERRAYATAEKLFPNVEFIMASPDISYEDYPTAEISKDLMVNVMVGDTQRILIYPEKGFTVSQEMPDEVKAAMDRLIKLGFDKQIIR